MSETMTAIKRADGLIVSRIDLLEGRKGNYEQRMAEDYEDFFEEYSESAYMVSYELATLQRLARGLQDMREEEAVQYLQAKIGMLTDALLDMPLERRSTGRMNNIAFGLRLKVNQKLRKFYLRLLKILEDK